MSTPNRNDPCPCGSGKKYKKCCLINTAAPMQNVSAQTAVSAGYGMNTTNTAPASSFLMQAVALHQAGRLDDADAAYRRLLTANPNDSDALHYLGLIALQQGRFQEAVDRINSAIRINPAVPAFHSNLGNAYKRLGNPDSAIAAFSQAVRLDPLFHAAFSNMGNIFLEQGRLDDAAASFRKAISVRPDFAEAHYNLGNTLGQQGKLDEAVACYRTAILIRPDYAEAHHNLGNTLQKQGNLDEAVSSFQRTLTLKPDHADAHYNLGNSLQGLGKLDEAVASFRRALALKPDFAEAHSNLGVTLKTQDKLDEAIVSFRKAISFKPDFAEAYINLGNELRRQGMLDEALDCYRRAQSLRPDNGTRIASALLLPPIMGTRTEILESRAKFEQNLDSLIEEDMALTNPHEEYGATNFFLAYHGLNDKNIQQKIARFYQRACPALLYEATHCARQRAANSRLRIGFLSRFIYAHSVSACFNKVVGGLANRDEFQVSLISTHDHTDESARNTYPDFAGTHVRIPNSLDGAREAVAALELDVLVYLDIGMEPLSYFLAFSRLARVQCVIGGHPVTTGIGNLDYFLSSALAEPEDAEAHYSEKLVRLPIRPSYFGRPVLPAMFKTRIELGLPEDGHIYSCPMLLQKLHPDFDEAITRILQLDPGAHVILFEDRSRASWRRLLEERFERTIPDQVRNRVLFVPWINTSADFLSMNKVSDVVLDPFHFGIGTTAISTFSVGTPIVTRPGEFLRGRIGFQFCKLLDISECVAVDTEDYAQKAVAIATDTSLRDHIKAKIMANDHLLFDNPKPISDMANFFLSLEPQLNTVTSI